MKSKNFPGRKILRKIRLGLATYQEYENSLRIRTKKDRRSRKLI